MIHKRYTRNLKILFMVIVILNYNSISLTKIYKKIDKDGTIYFYNKEKQKLYRKRVFSNNRFSSLIEQYSRENKVDPYLITCIIRIESNFDPNAVSVAGAMGLMQLMQGTARIYNVKDPLDPEENIKAGIKHVKSLLVSFKNNVPLALAAYHAGIGRVKKRMKLPSIKSTKNYVKKIMILYKGSYKQGDEIKRLYKKITRDGTILIYSR